VSPYGRPVARGRCLATTLCYPPESLAAYKHALRLMDEHATDTPELRALALAGLAWVETASGDVDRAQRLIEQVQALPEVADDAVLNAELRIARAATLLRTGHVEACEQLSVAAADDAHRADRLDIASTALLQAATAHACRGDFAGALELAEQMRRSWAGTGLAVQALAARAYALARLGRCEEAWTAVCEELTLAGRIGGAEHEATAMFDAGSVALDVGRPAEAVEYLAGALAEPQGRFPHALARIRLAEARLRAGDPEAAAAELERVPFESIGPTDLPETLVLRVERLEGLIGASHGECDFALRQLRAAETGWRRLLDVRPIGDFWAASLVDLGRAPVAGLVEPALELGQVLVERAGLLAAAGRTAEAIAAKQEAARLATALGVENYRCALGDIPIPTTTKGV
jgi:ATP/maltotriose-dependent transcriptional regulator MalT